ncbi:hypothetical protein [Sphingomonas radiodurans]|uniref:hypothetical protein n=1 Tax=Sphingomonas radiodurans TaxID=2890321 RepID=UPI001E44CF2F|nr:hypothetical protein [Sphingomonas radiodurans]WBH15021.1 hypothetical protein LLW23_09065 [Sphingomonas radiodurans]
MPGTALPRRQRIRPIAIAAGVAPQFERTDDGYFYREDGTGPAIHVTVDERDGFVRAGTYAFLYHLLAFAMCAAAAWLVASRLLADAGRLAVAGSTGVVAALAAILLLISHEHATRAPARALRGRPAVQPPRDPDFEKSFGYGAALAAIVIAILWWLTGSAGTIADRSVVGVFAILVGGFGILRRRRSYRRLDAAQRARALAAHAREEQLQRERLARAKPVNGCGLILFFLVELAMGVATLFGTIVIVLDIAGQPAEEPDGWIFAGAFLLGITLSCLVVSALDRLCKRRTGASALNEFNWIPSDW